MDGRGTWNCWFYYWPFLWPISGFWHLRFFEFLQYVEPGNSEAGNYRLLTPISDKEIKEAAFQFGGSKALGPDGFNGHFYHSTWDTVGQTVRNLVREFFNGSGEVGLLNNTNLVLILKLRKRNLSPSLDLSTSVISHIRLYLSCWQTSWSHCLIIATCCLKVPLSQGYSSIIILSLLMRRSIIWGGSEQVASMSLLSKWIWARLTTVLSGTFWMLWCLRWASIRFGWNWLWSVSPPRSWKFVYQDVP